MEVARALSSQKPGDSDSCLSFSILASLLTTSKKPPQDQETVSHILYCFCSHGRKYTVIRLVKNLIPNRRNTSKHFYQKNKQSKWNPSNKGFPSWYNRTI